MITRAATAALVFPTDGSRRLVRVGRVTSYAINAPIDVDGSR